MLDRLKFLSKTHIHIQTHNKLLVENVGADVLLDFKSEIYFKYLCYNWKR